MVETWDIFDVWGLRLDNATSRIIHGTMASMNETMANGMGFAGNQTVGSMRFNVTEMSHVGGQESDGRAGEENQYLGAGGVLSVEVPMHGVVVYRLRRQGKPKVRRRDEL